VASALAQTWSDKEIIVLDDGSTDGSMEALAPFRGQLRIERVANGGQNASRNRLTALSRGEWLAYLDADDELAPDSIEQKMRFAGAADAIYGSFEFASFRGAEKVESHKVAVVDHPDPVAAAFQWKFPNTSCLLFRRSAVEAAGGWNERIQNCTDYDLYFRMLAHGLRFKAAPAAWSLYRQWSSTQAVNEAPLRRHTTHLAVMRNAAQELRRIGQMTPFREQVFLDESLVGMRAMFQLDPRRAVEEHRRLRSDHPDYRPLPGALAAGYVFAYRLFGFMAAERLAAFIREIRRLFR
jgi:GT2 family glycosyltransferase